MGGGVDLRSYNLDWSEVFLISSTEIKLEIDDFSRFILENGIENIFWSQPSEKFLMERNLKLRFKDSKVFFIFKEQCVFWSDSWGYFNIEDFQESYDNHIFFAINRLKQEFSKQNYWQDSTGSIYEDIKNKGWIFDNEFEKSVRFFEGYVAPEKISKIIMKYSYEYGFRNIKEILISERAGFRDFDDYSDGREFKAPDKSTLESFRTLEKLEFNMSLKNKTHALLFAILLQIKLKLKDKTSHIIPFENLGQIYETLLLFMPKTNYAGFIPISGLEELHKVILEEPSYSLLGFYDRSSDAFQFSELKLYVDASSILHNGPKRGYENKDEPYPNIYYLEDCLRSLKKNSIEVSGIYIDSGTARSVINYEKDFREKYLSIASKYFITPTFTNEKADERLIQKLKDDPNCFVITNDGYDEYNLKENEKKRLISFQRTDSSSYSFYMSDGTDLNKFLEGKTTKFKEFLNVKPLRELGNWPYKEQYDLWEIESFSLALFRKLNKETP